MSHIYQPCLHEIERDFARLVYHWCRSCSLQDSDAADVTQTVLLKVLQALRRRGFRGSRAQFRAWLKTITANAIRDLVRSWKSPVRGTGESGNSAMAWHLEDHRGRVQDWIDDEHRRRLLGAAKNKVRNRVRSRTWKVFELCAIDGMSAREVAQKMSIQPRDVYTIKSRLTTQLRREVCRLDKKV